MSRLPQTLLGKTSQRLPGEPSKRSRSSKLNVKKDEILTRITPKELRQLLGKGYPCYLDFSPNHFQLESDEFLLNCNNIIKEQVFL
jgi:hypothetical protein